MHFHCEYSHVILIYFYVWGEYSQLSYFTIIVRGEYSHLSYLLIFVWREYSHAHVIIVHIFLLTKIIPWKKKFVHQIENKS